MLVQNSKFKVKNDRSIVIPTSPPAGGAWRGLLNSVTWGEKIPPPAIACRLGDWRAGRLRFTTLGMTIIYIGLLSLNPSSSQAASVSNDNFEINIDQLDVAPEEQKKFPTPTPQSVENGNFGIATLPYAFSFSVSTLLLDFGVLSATNPVARNATLAVSSPGNGYQVIAYQDHTLLSKKNALIPDTTCDNGSCSEITPSLWQNNLTYGFGFRCDALTQNACFEEFEAENTYKQFSDRGKKEIPQPIMLSDSPVNDQQAKLTYRVNISGTQTREVYFNTVTYIAVPNF